MNKSVRLSNRIRGLLGGVSEELKNLGGPGLAPHQGMDSSHADHPLHHTLTSAGYKYSHSNKSFTDSGSTQHHYDKPKAEGHKFQNAVTINSKNTSHWKSFSNKHKTVEGEGASSLASHLKSANS